MKRTLVSLTVALCLCGAAIAQDGEVWVTMGEDAFDDLARTSGVLSSAAELTAFDSDSGVVVTRLAARDLHAVAAHIHKNTNRCSGFIVHDSYDEAVGAMETAASGTYQALASAFAIDQQTLVNQLLPLLDDSNILSTITHLSTAYNNRYYLNASGEQSALWIRDTWQSYAGSRTDVTVETYSHAGYNQPSVILTIDGATTPSEVVVLGAHLDSIKSGANNSDPATLAPGADDDASGIATLTEVIRVLLANGFVPDKTVKFMGYAAEEVGLQGSSDIAADFAAAGTNVVAVMQLDMTDYNGSVEDIVLIDDYTNVDLTSFVIDLVTTYQPALAWTYTTCGYACSDHASWTNNGYPAAFPFEARFGQYNPTIHTSNDTVATLGASAAHALKFAKVALSFTVEIGLADACGDGTCDAGEDCNTCAADCPSFPLPSASCGNGLCEAGDGEDCVSCAADCAGVQSGKPSGRWCCGFGGAGPLGCGDSRCTTGGFACTETPQGSGGSTCCGDLVCEAPEDGSSCAVDCGAPPICGDATCDPGEDECSCAADCGAPPTTEVGLCTDGADNDCDLDVDCADADCDGVDPACLPMDCSTFGDKQSCNAEPTCRWNNKNKVCVPN